MPATPNYVGDAEPRWFRASFTGGNCATCDERIIEGDEIAYIGDKTLIRRDCCEHTYSDAFTLTLTERLDTTQPQTTRVMPPGKTAADRCPRCFLIHTKAQGDEC